MTDLRPRTAPSRRRLIALLALATLGACDPVEPLVCDASALAAISLSVEDSIAGGQVTADTMTATATEGAYADTVTVPSDWALTGLGLAYERAGTYDLSVTAQGYQPWQVGDVEVTQGECHVNGVALTARLQKL